MVAYPGMRTLAGRTSVSTMAPLGSKGKAVDLCNRFIEDMALGSLVPEGQEIRISGLPAGMRCHHAGSTDDPDFSNVHLEIKYPQ